MLSTRVLLASLLFLAPGSAQEGGPAEVFRARVRGLYTFAPHELTQAQVDAKARELDGFWRWATRDPAATLPLLRAELKDPTAHRFFAYDGAKLLLRMSQEPADRQLAATSLARVDLRDVDHGDFLRTLFELARQGVDVRAGADLVLETPGFKAVFPQHALTLGQDFAYLLLAYQREEATWVPELRERLRRETHPTTQKTLLLVLGYSGFPEGREALATFATDLSRLESVRTHAKTLQQRLPFKLLDEGQPEVRELRRRRRGCLDRISDEALLAFDRLTLQLVRR